MIAILISYSSLLLAMFLVQIKLTNRKINRISESVIITGKAINSKLTEVRNLKNFGSSGLKKSSPKFGYNVNQPPSLYAFTFAK